MDRNRWFDVYSKMPICVQNLAFSIYGAKIRRERYNKHFHHKLAELIESERWDAARIRAFQDEKTRWIVKHAYETVPFYRRWYDMHGVHPDMINGIDDLHNLPILTKQIVREHQAELVSKQYGAARLRCALTSGTTGTPLKIRTTAEGQAFQWAVWWRHRRRFGLTIDDPFLMFGARVPIDAEQSKPPFWREDYFGHRTYLSTHHLTPKHIPAIIQFLNKRSYKFYAGYPSAIYVLCQYLLEHDIQLESKPNIITCGSDALIPAFEKTIRKALGVPVTEQYGMAEFAGNYSKCEHGRFHLDFECCHAELLPVEDTQRHELIFTGWGNPAMPFIRYAVGDHAMLGDSSICTCGRHSPWIVAIDGRTEDFIRTPDGRKIIGLNQVLEYCEGAREIQIYQDKLHEVEIRVVTGPGYSENSENNVLREMRTRVGNKLKIKFVFVDEIPRTVSGKFRAVVCNLKAESQGEAALQSAARE